MKWENLLIVAVVAAFGAVGVIALVASGTTTSPSQRSNADPSTVLADASADANEAASDPADDTTLTMDDAASLVEEARQLMGEARWDEATDRLASVPQQYVEVSGAGALALDLTAKRETWDQLRGELDAAVEATQWTEALDLLARMEQVATLNDELLAIRTQADETLARAKAAAHPSSPPTRPAPAPAPARPAARPAAKPAVDASAAKPASTAKPAPNRAHAASPAAAAGAAGAGDADDIQTLLNAQDPTAAQQAQLDEVLGAYAS